MLMIFQYHKSQFIPTMKIVIIANITDIVRYENIGWLFTIEKSMYQGSSSFHFG